jgi:hypothetical protein
VYFKVMDSEQGAAQEAPGTFTAASAQVLSSAWVVQFFFGDVLPGPDGKLREVPRLAIGVPWPLAKMLHRVLGAAIAQFEANEGPITVPKTVASQMDELEKRSASPAKK